MRETEQGETEIEQGKGKGMREIETEQGKGKGMTET